MSWSLGIPVKLLHESVGHVVTVELKNGELYRGNMIECEDNWNCQLESITYTAKVKMLRRGLKELGIMKDEGLHTYHQLNPTSIGHYLGMNVHDSSVINIDRPLQPGVVITIEPGIYIPSAFDAPDRYRGIGIRIEDEVLIAESGHEVLTGSMPKEIPHIKSLLNFRSTDTDALKNR